MIFTALDKYLKGTDQAKRFIINDLSLEHNPNEFNMKQDILSLIGDYKSDTPFIVFTINNKTGKVKWVTKDTMLQVLSQVNGLDSVYISAPLNDLHYSNEHHSSVVRTWKETPKGEALQAYTEELETVLSNWNFGKLSTSDIDKFTEPLGNEIEAHIINAITSIG